MDGGVVVSPAQVPAPHVHGPRFFHMPRFQNPQYQQKSGYSHRFHHNRGDRDALGQNVTFDGKRMRKAVYRKTVDYNTSVLNYLENRVWQRDQRDRRVLLPDALYANAMVPPPNMLDQPMNCVTSKFIRTSTNKIRCPIFCVCWTPEGRRLVTGASSGEFTLWSGLTFNFETILQAHDTSVRSMVWSHNDQWMLTGDHAGFVKYWQSNMNNVKMYQAHKDPIRGLRCVPRTAGYSDVLPYLLLGGITLPHYDCNLELRNTIRPPSIYFINQIHLCNFYFFVNPIHFFDLLNILFSSFYILSQNQFCHFLLLGPTHLIMDSPTGPDFLLKFE
jgi:polyadenylation factor subunit 2